MAVNLTEDMKAVIAAQRLCFAATVTPDGKPSLSPKGTIRVWDERHLFFCDIASPGTRANLQQNPWIELNVVDPLSRRGYRFLGTATLHAGDDVYAQATSRVFREEGSGLLAEGATYIAFPTLLSLAMEVCEWARRRGSTCKLAQR